MPAAHRLVLTVPELALLLSLTGTELPPGFVTPADGPAPDAEEGQAAEGLASEAEEGLRRRGLLDGDRAPVAAVMVILAVLGGPEKTVRGAAALHVLAGGLGASLRLLAGDEVELSLFPAWEFDAELRRAVLPLG